MTEDKKDSFWDSKNDDFWSKPVISDDWLKTGDDSFWESSFGTEKEPENSPLSTGSQSIKIEDKKESTRVIPERSGLNLSQATHTDPLRCC